MLTEQEKELVKYGKSTGKTDQQIMQALSKMRTETQIPSSQMPQLQGDGIATDVVEGVGKSIGETALGMGTIGRNIQRGISKVGDAVLGKYNPFSMGETNLLDSGSEQNIKAKDALKPKSTAESVGKFIGDTAQFLIPGTAAGKATAGASMATRALAQGGASAMTQYAKSGSLGSDEALAFATGALSVPAGDVIEHGISSLSNHLPEWLVRPLLKQAPNAKLKGKDAAKYLVDSGRIGTVDSLIRQTDDAISTLNTQVDSLIEQGTGRGVTVQRDALLHKVSDAVNTAGGKLDTPELLRVIDNLAPQARGLLSKDTLTLQEANQLRKLLDNTLGDRAFLSKELTFNKQLLMDFTNSLRETVKSSDEALRPLYEEYAKNVTLKNALMSRAVAGGGANSVGLYDILAGGAGLATTGSPLVGLAIAGGRRALESAPVKTALAQVFKNADAVIPIIQKMEPPARAILLSTIALLEDSMSSKQK